MLPRSPALLYNRGISEAPRTRKIDHESCDKEVECDWRIIPCLGPARSWPYLAGVSLSWLSIWFQRDLANLFLGPFPLERATLLALHDPAELQTYHVSLQADQEQPLFPSAYTLGQPPYSYYAILDLGDKCLLVGLAGPAWRPHLQRPAGTVHALRERIPPGPLPREKCGKELLPFRLNMTRPLWFTVFYFRIVPLALLLAAALWQTTQAWKSLKEPRHGVSGRPVW